MKQTTIRFRFVGNVVLLAVLLMMGAVPAASAQQASLLVRVVADEDCDGTLSGFESPLANWNVFVDENGNGERDDQEPTQVSGGDGYAFLSVNPGTFLVGVERPDDWVPTLPASGFHTVTLEANEHADLPDLGNIRGGSVIGMKFEDIDGDGTFEPLDGEIGLEGWEISMTGTSCAGAAMAYTTTTNEDGIYTFDNVTPGDDFTLFETQQADWNQTFPLGDGLHHADVSSAATVLGNDFGNQRNVPTGVIYGFKFRDLSRDGHYQESEPRLPGWTIYLDLNQNALLDGEEPQTITLEDDSATPEDETGMFRFEDLPSDNYLVREVQQDGWQRTGSPPTPFFLIPDVEVQVLIGNVELAAPLDFGDAPDPGYATLLANDGPRHTIVPGVFLGTGVDAEADGQPHSRALGDDSNGADDEEGVIFNSPLMRASQAQITVTASVAGFLDAWADYNRSGVFDESENLFGESMALTAGANLLTFAVPDVAITERLFVRFRFSTTGGLGPTGLAGDGEVEDYALGAILGFKFKDDNKSSTRDNTSLADSTRPERLLPDWTFFLLSNHLDVTPITFTDSLGAFRFTGLPPGEYFLDEELQEGWQRVVINTDSLSIDPGTIFRDLPIGNHCAFITLSGLKWRDDDGNGMRGDEPGWDWTIILDGTNIWGETVHREITTERWKGDYAFEFVEPGSYTIKEESREGWIQTKPTGGEYQVEVNCGDKVIDQDFGNEPAGLYTLRPSPVLLRVGDTGTLTITLTKPAPTGGVTFTLSIDDDDIAGISSTTVTIAEGEEQASLTVTAKKADDTEVTITQATEGWEPKGQGDDKTAVRVGPDLSITPDAIDIPITDIATLKYKIRATVTNAPERVNADPFKVKIEEEDPKTGDVRVLYDMNLPGLAGGSSTTIEVDYLPEIPRALIRVFVDAANVLEEKDEGNNKATKEFVVTLIEDVTALFDGDKDPDIFGRFISHPELADVENTFTADVLDGVEIEKVVFELNDIVIEDGSSGGGWTADYSMGLLPDGTNKMTIFAIGPRDMKSEPITKVVKIEEFPDWIKVSVNIGLLGFGGSVELTPTHLFVAFSFKLGASKGGGPFSYQAQINNVVEFIPKESIDAETKLEFKLGIPLDEDVGWAGGGTFTLTQRVLGKEVGKDEVEVQMFLNKDHSLNSILVRYGKEALLYSWEIRRSFPITSGVSGVLGGGFDILARLNIQVVAGEGEDRSVEFIRTPTGKVSSLLPGLGIRANLIVGLEILFGLISGEVILSPQINLDVGATYTTATGVRPFASGEFLVGWRLIGALFWGVFEREIASGEFGPWPLFEAGGKIADPAASDQVVYTDAVILPSVLPLPSLAADPNGRVMAVWLEKDTPDGPPHLYFAMKEATDTGFDEPARLVENEMYKADPMIAFGPDGTAHAVWVQNAQPESFLNTDPTLAEILNFQDIYHAFWNGTAWSAPQPVTPEAAGAERGDGVPAILVSPDGSRQLVLWTRNVQDNALDRAGLEVFSASLDGGTPGVPVALTNNAMCDLMVRGVFLDDDTALALWLRDVDGNAETVDDFEVQYAIWEDGVWGAPAPLTNNDRQENHLSVARLANGRGLAAWVEVTEQEDGTLHYKLLTSVYDPAGDTWSTPEVVHESVHFIETPIVQVDARNIATVTWRGYYNEHLNGDLLLALKDFRQAGAPWTAPRALTDDALADWMATATIDATGNQYVLSLKSQTQETTGKVAYQPNFHSGLHLVTRGILNNLELSENLLDDLNLGTYKIAPDLHVDSTSIAVLDANPRAGQEATLRLTVVNQGAIASPASVARLFDQDPQSGGMPIGPDLLLPALDPDASHAVSFSYTLTGQDILFVQVDPDAAIDEQTKENNQARTVLRLLPDLVGDGLAVQFDQAPAPGSVGTVSVTLTNQGQGVANAVPVHFLIAETDSLQDAVRFAAIVVAAIEPGETLTIGQPYQVERPGRHTVFAVINPEGTLVELSETNNVASTAFDVLSDLAVESISTQHGFVRAAILNAGGLPAEDVAGYLYVGNPLAGGVAVDSVTISSLAPGARDTLQFSYAVSTGLIELYVWLDPHETAAEVSRENNRRGTQLAISGTADLKAELGVLGPYPLAGADIPLLVRISNVGTRGASVFTYQLFQGATPTQADSLIATRQVAVVNPGDTVIDTVGVTLLGQQLNAFLLQVDTNDEVEELDEENNQADFGAATALEEAAGIPEAYFIDAAYPNPFNPQTTIRYGVPEASRVRIDVFNVLGQHIATLIDENQAPGIHHLAWTPRQLASGVYFLRIDAQGLTMTRFLETRKVVLLR